MSDTKQPPKRRRRWFRYSLRTLFVVVTILCVVLAYWVQRANRQKAAVKWVEENGGNVYYDFEHDENGDLIDDAQPPGPKWVRDFLGKDYLSTVITAGLKHCKVKDVARLAMLGQLRNLDLYDSQVSDLTPLAGLKRLEFLMLDNTQVSDLTPLAGLTSLEWLWLNRTQVSDLTPLAGLKSLEHLRLENTQIRDLTPLAGLTSLEYLHLDHTHVRDLTPLAGLTSLTVLSLYKTPVTEEQIVELQNALPNCEIRWSPADKASEGN